MAKTAKYSYKNKMGCGFISSVLRLRSFKPSNSVVCQTLPHSKKQLITNSSKSAKPHLAQSKRLPIKPIKPTSSSHKNRHQGVTVSNPTTSSTSPSSNNSNKASKVVNSSNHKNRNQCITVSNSTTSSTSTSSNSSNKAAKVVDSSNHKDQNQSITLSNATTSSTSPSSNNSNKAAKVVDSSNHKDQHQSITLSNPTSNSTSSSPNNSNKASKVVDSAYTRRTTSEPTFTSGELRPTLKKSNSDGALHRASTGNVILLGRLGSLKKRQAQNDKNDVLKRNVTTTMEKNSYQLGNIYNQLEPDALNCLGNEKYKQGKYDEALTLYDKAIAIDPSKACYYTNKSAALTGLGRLAEAAVQCKEAIRVDYSYHSAHFRLAKLYLRLGVAERAVYHYKCSGRKASYIAKAQNLGTCLDRLSEARNNGEWRRLLKESKIAISLGADSAPQIYAMRAEAWMNLQRHQEAYNVIRNKASFSNIELYAELLGSSATAGVLETRALVYMTNGRFDDAVAAIHHVLELDPSSKRFKLTAERINSVSLARLDGNWLYEGSRYSEALIAYNEGLEIDPHNYVLMCNRAACRYKLGQFEKGVEDCTTALVLRPSYSKSRLHRANCNAKLEKWESAVQDYEVLIQERPGDEEVSTALLEAKTQLKKLHNIMVISSRLG